MFMFVYMLFENSTKDPEISKIVIFSINCVEICYFDIFYNNIVISEHKKEIIIPPNVQITYVHLQFIKCIINIDNSFCWP